MRFTFISVVLSALLMGCTTLSTQAKSFTYLPKYMQNYNLQRVAENSALRNCSNESGSLLSYFNSESKNTESTAQMKFGKSTLYLTTDQLELLHTSNAIADKLFHNESELYFDLESAPAIVVYKVSNVHFILGGVSLGEGVLFDNQNKKIHFLNIHRFNYGLGLGYQDLYVVLKINSMDKLKSLLEDNNIHLDARFMFMLGFWGKQFSLTPGINLVYMDSDGFDLGWQSGVAVYSSQKSGESQPSLKID